MSARPLRTAAHEASHAAAAICLGVGVDLVSRDRLDGGLTATRASGEDAQVILLAPVLADPGFGGDGDVRQARSLGNTDRASDRAWKLLKDPEYRRIKAIIERALVSRPCLYRDDLEKLLAPGGPPSRRDVRPQRPAVRSASGGAGRGAGTTSAGGPNASRLTAEATWEHPSIWAGWVSGAAGSKLGEGARDIRAGD
jgi:hypothetical protein